MAKQNSIEEIVQLVTENPDDPGFKGVLTGIMNAITMHKVHKQLGTYKGIWFGEGLPKEECSAVLRGYIQISEGEVKKKLAEDLDYWNANYDEIARVWM